MAAEEAEAEAVAVATHEGNKCACEIRRVGDTEWRRVASRADADGVFPGLSKNTLDGSSTKPQDIWLRSTSASGTRLETLSAATAITAVTANGLRRRSTRRPAKSAKLEIEIGGASLPGRLRTACFPV